MALEPAKLSDFRLAGALGSGTTARVYEAVHLPTGRAVAVKMMEQSGSTSEMRERFAREAVLLSSLDSRHVTKILSFGFEQGRPFLVLERLHGETLDAKLRRDGPVPPAIAVRWIEQLLVGVRDCHDAKVIHRDIKPSNIFLHHNGFEEGVKLIDFGVARLREIAGEEGGLTSNNHLIGSMGYMAPEQFKSAKTVGFPADLYAVGVVVFRTLTGRLPFVSRSLDTVIRMKTEQRAPTISSMGVLHNPLLDWFVQTSMIREPEDRFQSAREMLEHWWNVVASLDEDGTTKDIMRGIGRVDESYAGPMPRHPTPVPATLPHPAIYRTPDSAEESRVRRPRRAAIALPSALATPFAKTVLSRPDEDVAPHHHTQSQREAWRDAPPRTTPSHELPSEDTMATSRAPLHDEERRDQDPFDLPTRIDPSLRKLVERELELQKTRTRPPK